MGLSAMDVGPGAEEIMRVSNNVGHAQYINQNQWLGESSMDALGLGDIGDAGQTAAAVASGFQSLAQSGLQVYGQIQAAKAQRKGSAKPQQNQQQQSNPMAQNSGVGGSNGFMGMSWGMIALIGGGLIGLILLMSMMKKKSGGVKKKGGA